MSTSADSPRSKRDAIRRPVETAFAVALLLLLLFSVRDSLPQHIVQNAQEHPFARGF